MGAPDLHCPSSMKQRMKLRVHDSKSCTVMSIDGPMQWIVPPMGAKNGNTTFVRMMEDILAQPETLHWVGHRGHDK